MATERVNAAFSGMDCWPTDQLVRAMLEQQEHAARAIRAAIPFISAAANDSALRLEDSDDGRIIDIGAGTSIRMGVVDLTELYTTFGWPPVRTAFASAGGKIALQRPVENAEDNIQAALRQMKRLKPKFEDVCIAIAASGATRYTLAACRAAQEAGALTIGIANNRNAELLQLADHAIFINTGPEPVSGSTRMNAGTSQKIVLNLLSTAIMTRLGRVYNGLMVCMIPTNEKLRKRAVAIVSEITGCDDRTASRALDDARKAYNGLTDKNIKLAVLMVCGMNAREGMALLETHRYHLRPALDALTPR